MPGACPKGGARTCCDTGDGPRRGRRNRPLLIAAAYKGHVDATINDQYGSVTGARRFIHNIVQYPGCGRFFPAVAGGGPAGRRHGRNHLGSLVRPIPVMSRKYVFCLHTKGRESDMS